MQLKKTINTLLYTALVSSFIATLISYNLPNGIKDIAKSILPARAAKKLGFIFLENPINYSSLTIGFLGVMITFGIFAGISLLFVRRKPNVQG